jgi:hypothetical protein
LYGKDEIEDLCNRMTDDSKVIVLLFERSGFDATPDGGEVPLDVWEDVTKSSILKHLIENAENDIATEITHQVYQQVRLNNKEEGN